jgi:hypothetical protein
MGRDFERTRRIRAEIASKESQKAQEKGQEMKEKKAPKHFRENKLAFDELMSSYRSAKDTGIGAAVWANGGGTVTKNPARPSLTDLRCDIEKIVEAHVNEDQLCRFWAVYSIYDSNDYIEREMFADRMIGPKRHSYEQRIGAKFITNGLYPVQKYLLSIRKPQI